MTDLLWPGDERAGALFGDAALLAAMVRVESAWLDALVEAGVAAGAAKADLSALITGDDLGRIAEQAEAGGNPIIPLVTLLRSRLAADALSAAGEVEKERGGGRAAGRGGGREEPDADDEDPFASEPVAERAGAQHAGGE